MTVYRWLGVLRASLELCGVFTGVQCMCRVYVFLVRSHCVHFYSTCLTSFHASTRDFILYCYIMNHPKLSGLNGKRLLAQFL